MSRTERDKKRSENDIYAMLPYFHDVVILGDSIAESLLDYRLLRKNNVIAKRGRSVNLIDGDLIVLFSLQPKVVFMEYGRMDIKVFLGDEKRFCDLYKQKIMKIKQEGINEIYVNSILPVREDRFVMYGGHEVFERFNKALADMCAEMEVTFVDNDSIMKWKFEEFEFDGIHPKYPFYQKWLWHLIAIANLQPK